ncbi:phosphotransferase [Paenibacillus radicis (ex Gao et al. 2016)]|uniref:Aminoglycoside phosphotransferase n=1 Tax=Paenibacillus radicis (ex Gao et al. 2016) TaxID=1737354 RepID=A0A917LVN0_9BACL|nr:phosphotransferase [Paenibacillus radicis (ex Gao et al. 2016)]GGG61299.1 aminoglycoside phosphotransferase [Paenibacillus radicis (ex Gao et al. 2016)]
MPLITSEVQAIIDELRDLKKIEAITSMQPLKGTTDGLVFLLEDINQARYILKFDDPESMGLVSSFLTTYEDASLLPRLLYADDGNHYMLYTFQEGTTHVNRGTKKAWLSLLVKEQLNKYEPYTGDEQWGRFQWPRESWLEFNEISYEQCKANIADVLPEEDHRFVKELIPKLYGNAQLDERYLLHGDTGIHNFVFRDNRLVGVIDPSPMAGPILYDFCYAFCSSSDDINEDTLFTAHALLERGGVEHAQLVEEVAFQLYCRIGICLRHHPDDLPGYLTAWSDWKKVLAKQIR